MKNWLSKIDTAISKTTETLGNVSQETAKLYNEGGIKNVLKVADKKIGQNLTHLNKVLAEKGEALKHKVKTTDFKHEKEKIHNSVEKAITKTATNIKNSIKEKSNTNKNDWPFPHKESVPVKSSPIPKEKAPAVKKAIKKAAKTSAAKKTTKTVTTKKPNNKVNK